MTQIEWAQETWQVVSGCDEVSPGCRNCYSARLAGTRLKNKARTTGLARKTTNGRWTWTGEVRIHEDQLDVPLHWRKPRRIFVADRGDLFHEKVPFEFIDRVLAVVALCPQHMFLILTKRAERMRAYMANPATPFRVVRQMDTLTATWNLGPEKIRPIAGYPGYFASSHGFIYSERRGRRRKMRPDAGDQGHQRVQLHREASPPRGDRLSVHRIILETFIGPPPSPDAQGRHSDGDPSNNAVSNLMWGGQDENWSDSRRHGTHRRYSKLNHEQAVEIRRRHAAGETGEALAREYGVSAPQIRNIASGAQWAIEAQITWPLKQCWLGVSVEDQVRADERIPSLLETPAAVRWISAEPLLGAVDLTRICIVPQKSGSPRAGIHLNAVTGKHWESGVPYSDRGLDWVVAGGESGPGARPMHPDWARALRDQCAAAGAAFFFKQWGAWSPEWASARSLNVNPKTGQATDPNAHMGKRGLAVQNENTMFRVGKKAAGARLDGRLHAEFPA